MMNYKGYMAKIAFDDDVDIFHGEVINIRDVVTFQGKSVAELREEMRGSVDDYIVFCEERGEKPERPFSGNFPIRSTAEEHRLFVVAATAENKSLNVWAREKLKKAANG